MMLRVTVELVPHGTGSPKSIGLTLIGQAPITERHEYVGIVWDDLHHTNPVTVAVDHDRDAGVWALIGTALEAAAVAPDPDLEPQTIALLETLLADAGGRTRRR